MNYNWNWGIFWQAAPGGQGTYAQALLSGLMFTLAVGLLAWIMALILGSIVGTVRTTPSKWAVRIGNGYVELFRNIPLLVQMYMWYFVIPEFLPGAIGSYIKSMPNEPFVTAVICLGFFTSARVAEQVRAGINSLPRGQSMAGTAMGLTPTQTYMKVILPQAFRIIIPPMTSEFLNVIKNSSVALYIGVMELTAQARSMQEFSFQVFEAFSAATLLYVAINVIVLNLVIARTWKYLFFTGMTFTVELTLMAMVGGIIFGTILALGRLSHFKWLSIICGTYVNGIRSVPLVLVIFWFYFLVPYIGAWVIGSPTPIPVGAFTSSLVTFILFEAAYYCEIMRAGIQSISRGQVMAGQALGMTYFQNMGNIVLPQAFRNMIPILLTQTIVLFQDVSLVSILSITDFVGAARKIAERDGRQAEMYLFVGVVYFVICLSLSMLVKQLQRRVAIVR